MFSNIGWGEIFVLMVAALVILGPERLPGAAMWLGRTARQARDYVSGASKQLQEEFGTDIDEFRKPLSELQKLRGMNPRSVVTRHLLDGDDSFFTGNFDDQPGRGGAGGSASGANPGRPHLNPERAPLGMDEMPPIDPDAT
ncbi:Sec-independent protein translocase subunit TatB [Hoyosella sp. G463]|uniref:Sec-independent protein translocase protein TatB n=1 Tax=Lolliginicoccus lacisalsi TaxID=2742202 RepID=A0A927JBS7_9ACTN|nr:Sec-independent protein translocase subunit TatB [Lolliginicoccus lacisalsi]